MMSKYSGEKRRVSKKEKGPACCYRNRSRGEEYEEESVNVGGSEAHYLCCKSSGSKEN